VEASAEFGGTRVIPYRHFHLSVLTILEFDLPFFL
jgi:hypothetical protein